MNSGTQKKRTKIKLTAKKDASTKKWDIEGSRRVVFPAKKGDKGSWNNPSERSAKGVLLGGLQNNHTGKKGQPMKFRREAKKDQSLRPSCAEGKGGMLPRVIAVSFLTQG